MTWCGWPARFEKLVPVKHSAKVKASEALLLFETALYNDYYVAVGDIAGASGFLGLCGCGEERIGSEKK